MKHTFSELVDIFGKQEPSELFRDKALELQQPQPSRFTPAQRMYLVYRLGRRDGKRAIRLGEDLKKIKRIRELAYWCNLYLQVTEPESPPNSKLLSPDAIQRAREYPTHQLYDGRLIRSGRNFKAKCPLLEERTPSFIFYVDGHYHCFGCQAHGNSAIDYVMATEKLSFPDAVRRLL